MLKLLLIVLCIILCLLSCSRQTEESAETAVPPIAETVENEETEEEPIAWVSWSDFVKYNGQTYQGDWNETTVPLENVGKLLGYIENHVPSEIRNFDEYTAPDNASPSRETGSPFYAVTGSENAIAVYYKPADTYYLYILEE